MAEPRVIGIETEYGILAPGDPSATATSLSSQVVQAYGAEHTRHRRAGWDYQQENPLRDARGFDLARGRADPGLLTDDDPGMANLVLSNGARLYVDHAHPEYSSPEVTSARAAVVWDVAGERVLARAAELASLTGPTRIGVYKNNVDNKGASYGCHENYLTDRGTPFEDLVAHLTPFLVSRQVVVGAGRVGRGADGSTAGFQLSQRADYIEVEVGLETTLKRPIINTRDEPHADPERYRRLHLIIGDANCSETATLLKLGTTALVLDALEAGDAGEPPTLLDPVAEVSAVSHDPSLRHLLTLSDGRRMTAVQLQQVYLDRVLAHLRRTGRIDDDPDAAHLVAVWADVLDGLARDPMGLADRLDWVAKLHLLESYRSRDGLGWEDPKLALVDLQYADVRADRGLYHRLVRGGRMQRVVGEEEVLDAVTRPPEDTRAYFRGVCVDRFAADVAMASWDSVIFDLPGRAALQRVPTSDPLRGTRAHVGALLDASADATELVDRLTTSG